MNTERATSDGITEFTPEVPTPRAGEDGPYPPAPSAALCAALVPCRHHSAGCPLGVDVPAVARAIAGGNHETAFRIVRAAHPFPSSCGNACYAPCESACRRRPFGAPIAIATLEEFAASFAAPETIARGGPCTSRFEARSVAGAIGRAPEEAFTLPRVGRTVAIIGAGAAGLACAHDLSLLGHRSVLFDERSEPGGLMTSGIPAMRFPVANARTECAAILGPLAEFRGGAAIQSLHTLSSSGFDAVFVAIGAARAMRPPLAIPEQHPDIFDAMEVLTRDIAPVGVTIVVGEGTLALDAARLIACRAPVDRSGARPRPIQLVLTTSLDAEGMTPSLVAACARSGVHLLHGGRLRCVQFDTESGLLLSIDVAFGDDEAGRVLPCDRLILAGARVPDTGRFAGELDLTSNGHIATDAQTLRTSMPNVWAGGACAFGHRSIAHAVADGKRAAWEIHAALTGGRTRTIFASAWVEVSGRGKPDRTAALRRRALPLLDPPSHEPFGAATPRSAARFGEEAARCFDCAQIPVVTGECTSCGRCVEACPTGALAVVEKRAAIADDICNRCGDCIIACPETALTMLRAEWDERLTFV